MSLAAVGVLLLASFSICAWSGKTLARHYQDTLEVAATLAVAACVLGSLFLTGGDDAASAWPKVALAVSMGAGLFTGYLRSGPLR